MMIWHPDYSLHCTSSFPMAWHRLPEDLGYVLFTSVLAISYLLNVDEADFILFNWTVAEGLLRMEVKVVCGLNMPWHWPTPLVWDFPHTHTSWKGLNNSVSLSPHRTSFFSFLEVATAYLLAAPKSDVALNIHYVNADYWIKWQLSFHGIISMFHWNSANSTLCLSLQRTHLFFWEDSSRPVLLCSAKCWC